jgi:hypothetical protein
MIYYRAGRGVAVNLLTPSRAEIELDDDLCVAFRQETEYPHSGKVVIHVDPSKPATFPLRLRIPRWCKSASVTVGGDSPDASVEPGKFFEIKRRWQNGDVVRLDLVMDWRLVKGRKAQAGRVAVVRGPIVFCLNRSRHEKLADVDLRLITLDPASLEGPFPDDRVHPGGQACRVRAWGPGRWYPMAKTDLELTLTEFPDPDGEAVYFKIPNPNAGLLVDDELDLGHGEP